jgi:hypothetical protein
MRRFKRPLHTQVVVLRELPPRRTHQARYHSPPLRACASRDRELRRPLISRPCDKASVDEHRGIQRKTPVSGRVNCDKTVIRGAQNLEEHRGLRTHTG